PRAHEIEAEIGLKALLIEIERRQRTANHMREQCSGNRVKERRPEQKARNPPAEQRELRVIGERPENDEERHQRDDGIEQSKADRQDADIVRSAVDELLDV